MQFSTPTFTLLTGPPPHKAGIEGPFRGTLLTSAGFQLCALAGSRIAAMSRAEERAPAILREYREAEAELIGEADEAL
ncbi:hypothetical protein [Bradyrhizobium centrolobii]|uniref:hypothetical protein n=1 Tax=Bradyrhizobium centrolobii TaxID=1505087 RepID=UPI0010A95CAA|nr:hypothetical protein [Bradyrhizobium centrolobii]